MHRKGIVFLECDAPNQNGRIYPKKEIEKSLLRYQSKIKSGMAIGGFADDVIGSLPLDLGLVSHVVTHAEIVGDYLIGTIKIIEHNPKGAVLAAIINHPDVQFGPRGYGNIDANGVVSNFEFHSINVFIETPADKKKQAKATANYNYDRAMGIVKK